MLRRSYLVKLAKKVASCPHLLSSSESSPLRSSCWCCTSCCALIATKRVGIFGGTFDPIHNGHLHLINEIARAGIFSTLIIVPSGNPWQKKPQASAEDRLEMTRLALSGLTLENCEVLISDFEVVSSEPSYAIKTVMHLQEKLSGAAFTWIIGSDAASSLNTWHQVF